MLYLSPIPTCSCNPREFFVINLPIPAPLAWPAIPPNTPPTKAGTTSSPILTYRFPSFARPFSVPEEVPKLNFCLDQA